MPKYEEEVISCRECGSLVETKSSGKGKCQKCGAIAYTNSKLADMRKKPKSKKKSRTTGDKRKYQFADGLREDILAYIRDQTNGYEYGCKVETIVRGLDEEYSKIVGNLYKLKKMGKIESVKRGWWRIVGETNAYSEVPKADQLDNKSDMKPEKVKEKVVEVVGESSVDQDEKAEEEDVIIRGSQLAKVNIICGKIDVFVDKSEITGIGPIITSGHTHSFVIIISSQLLLISDKSVDDVKRVHSYLTNEISQQKANLTA